MRRRENSEICYLLFIICHLSRSFVIYYLLFITVREKPEDGEKNRNTGRKIGAQNRIRFWIVEVGKDDHYANLTPQNFNWLKFE